MKDKWRKWLRALGVVLILFGVGQLALPYVQNWMISRNMLKQEELFDEASADHLGKNKDTDAEFNFEAIENISPTSTFLDPSNIDPNLMLGNLYVPSVDINLVLFKGVTNQILNAGVGTMRPDQEMGVGNYPIAGHWVWDSILFADLDLIEEGDKIYVTDKKDVYEYETYETRTVHETEVQWIEDQVATEHGTPIIALMNCHFVDGKQVLGERMFVFGELKEVYDYKDAPKLKLSPKEKKNLKKKRQEKKKKKSAQANDHVTWPEAA